MGHIGNHVYGHKKADPHYTSSGAGLGGCGGEAGPDSMLLVSGSQGSRSGPSPSPLPFLPHSGSDTYLPFREGCGQIVHSSCSQRNHLKKDLEHRLLT